MFVALSPSAVLSSAFFNRQRGCFCLEREVLFNNESCLEKEKGAFYHVLCLSDLGVFIYFEVTCLNPETSLDSTCLFSLPTASAIYVKILLLNIERF